MCDASYSATARKPAIRARSMMLYIANMFEVLVYVYENYWQGDACPPPALLSRKLTAVGFDHDEIDAALVWLDGLNMAAQSTQIYLPNTEVQANAGASSSDTASPAQDTDGLVAPRLVESPGSLRVYSIAEQNHLGASALGFVSFLETSTVLSPHMREMVIDRAMASPGGPLDLDDLKIIVLMVYWSFGQEPDALVLDELCDDPGRIGH